MKKKRIWIVSELFYPENTSTGYILTKLAEGLANHFRIGVLCGQPSYSLRGFKAAKQESYKGIYIRRSYATTFNVDKLLPRLINLIAITLSLSFNGVINFKKDDDVLVVTNPPVLPFAILLVSRIKGAKCSIIVHDMYPDVAYAAGLIPRKTFLKVFFRRLNKILFRNMKKIFVLGRDMKEKIINEFGVFEEKIIIAPNWADIDEIRPVERNNISMLNDLNLMDKFVLLYAGNMGYPHNIEDIVAAGERLKYDKDICFVFMGSGSKRSYLETLIAEKDLSNIILLPQRDRKDQIEFLNACDVGLIALVKGMKGISVPSRTYNIMAAGKPIIAIVEQESEIEKVINEERIGWVVEPGSVDKLVEILKEAKLNSMIRKQMGERARAVAEYKYSYKNTLNIYLSALSNNG